MSAVIELYDEAGVLKPEDEALINAALDTAFLMCSTRRVSVEVSVVDDNDMRALNRDMRGIDRTTDVLSFPTIRWRGVPCDDKRFERAGLSPETHAVDVGEIVLCADAARRQSVEFGHSFTRELSFLCVHGALHLLGFDHESDADRAVMRAKEEEILKRLGQERVDAGPLIDLAETASGNAYAPYSHFAVGAALRTSDGEVFTGVNVENASFGLTSCAERNAVFAAVSAGKQAFTDIAVYAKTPPLPCGACRQVLAEFAPDLRVHIATPDGFHRTYTLKELLPHSFALKN